MRYELSDTFLLKLRYEIDNLQPGEDFVEIAVQLINDEIHNVLTRQHLASDLARTLKRTPGKKGAEDFWKFINH